MIVFMGIGSNTFFRIGGLLNGFILGLVFSRKLEEPYMSSTTLNYDAQESFMTKLKKISKLKIISLSVFVLMNLICLIFLFV